MLIFILTSLSKPPHVHHYLLSLSTPRAFQTYFFHALNPFISSLHGHAWPLQPPYPFANPHACMATPTSIPVYQSFILTVSIIPMQTVHHAHGHSCHVQFLSTLIPIFACPLLSLTIFPFLPNSQNPLILLPFILRSINNHPKTKKMLQFLRLRQIFNGVFSKVNKTTMNMLHGLSPT